MSIKLAIGAIITVGLIFCNETELSASSNRRIASSITGQTCDIGLNCSFLSNIYVCIYADALEISNSENRNVTANSLLRNKKCELYRAGQEAKIEPTQSPDVVYLSRKGNHIGYAPIGVFETTSPENRTANLAGGDTLPANVANLTFVVRPGIRDLENLTVENVGKCFAYGGEKIKSWRTSVHSNRDIVYIYENDEGQTISVYIKPLSGQALITSIDVDGDPENGWRGMLVLVSSACQNAIKRAQEKGQ